MQYSLPRSLPEWELPEVPVPESPVHDEIADRLRGVLVAWNDRTSQVGAVRRNLAIRWDEVHPRVGVDPDVCWLETVPPGFHEGEVDSLKLWLPGHAVPPLAVEIVSRSHPYKDYGRVQDKYAVVGVRELWVYDPYRFGPRARGGPVLLQLWVRTTDGVLREIHHGDAPVRSPLLGAWLLPRAKGHLELADEADGTGPWLTSAEVERARAEVERARAEAERARAQALEAELLELRRSRG
ncbi:MAG TPA: Uma2 family endonuclease [Polyangiaceae bacterium]|nr:Uma2 family endonuclease [Polyangiaceae bacterium]